MTHILVTSAPMHIYQGTCFMAWKKHLTFKVFLKIRDTYFSKEKLSELFTYFLCIFDKVDLPFSKAFCNQSPVILKLKNYSVKEMRRKCNLP